MSESENSVKYQKNPLPPWARDSFKLFTQHVDDLHRVLNLSIRGISSILVMPAVAEILANHDDNISEVEIEQRNKEAELAQQEIDRGFPLLLAQATVTLWGSLEALIHDFIAQWLTNESKAFTVGPILKLKVPLGEYETIDREERPYYIINLLERDLQSPSKQGISRFELLLDVFGLSGAVDDTVKKDLFEMYHIRNVIVHRRGIADQRLLRACPWLSLKIGEPVTISRQDYERYMGAITKYVWEIMVRIAVYFGQERAQFNATFLRSSSQDKH